MAEYINRQKLIDAMVNARRNLPEDWKSVYNGMSIAITLVKDEPAADVALVVLGQWIVDEIKTVSRFCHCSICGQKKMLPLNSILNYCSNCGSKMDEAVDDE